MLKSEPKKIMVTEERVSDEQIKAALENTPG